MKKNKKPMKKYLQACRLGGSIYGKTPEEAEEGLTEEKHPSKNGLTEGYSSLYKNQLIAMEKLFRRTR